ncbi:MAG TPA: sulfatase-like hydrolase/transferase [Bacillota bacterium]|nr:sulfatase-like hydrolase/transferase [Bacillota bacterium]
MIRTFGIEHILREGYMRGEQDYHLRPLVKWDGENPIGRIKDGDCVIFCCRRGDREVQLTEAFSEKDFIGFKREYFENLDFIPMTLYQEKFSRLNILFPVMRPENSLGKVISDAGLRQLRVAESEKFAHVTFFFNGRRVEAFANEDRIFIDSPPNSRLLENPGTSTAQVADAVIKGIKAHAYDFILTNLASGDMVGHLDNYDAKVACAASVDNSLGRIIEEARANGYSLVITADHGLLETGFTPDGKPNVSHTTALVPLVVISDEDVKKADDSIGGTLSDVAPTVLSLMKLEIPKEMGGRSKVVNTGAKKKVVLVVVDGWGLGIADPTFNPIFAAGAPQLEKAMGSGISYKIEASGIAVGLPTGRYGNSEVGHLTIGSGRMIPSDELRISTAIKDGSLATSSNLTEPFNRMVSRGGDLHLIMILSERSSHGNIGECMAIADAAGQNNVKNAYLHIILDGRSTPPQGAADLIPVLEKNGSGLNVNLELVTVMGREYGLDRGGNYEKKTKVAFDALVDGIGKKF